MERRQFTDEFKREAVRLASQPGISKAEISEDLGINANMLHRWVREQEGNPSRFLATRTRPCLWENSSACVVNWPRLERSAIF